MSFDFIEHKESNNLIPLKIENKERYYLDLLNIEHSWKGRLDAQLANTFILESNQLLVNAITLFEQGYFDCAYYSLRQSLEVSTTMTYLIDNDEETRNKELRKWKDQSHFPMYGQMIKFLDANQTVFSDIKEQMHEYFEDLNTVKKKLNKYVHKQGFKTFYISKNHSLNRKKDQSNFIAEFERYLEKCIGAVADFRLTIDPFPILLIDEDMYSRTEDTITKGYNDDFIERYIGTEHIECYKKTEMYVNHYDSIIQEEAKESYTSDVVKNQFIDKEQIDNILKQKHLLSQHDIVAVVLCGFSKKVSKIYCIGGLHMYFSSTKSIRENWSWSSEDFNKFESSKYPFNQTYDEAYISCIELYGESYFMEHNEELDENEIQELEILKTLHTTMAKKS